MLGHFYVFIIALPQWENNIIYYKITTKKKRFFWKLLVYFSL